MKKPVFILSVLFYALTINLNAQDNCNETKASLSTSIGMVIYSNDTETMWNALRLANYSKNAGDTVTIFLLGKGVELDTLVKSDVNLKEQTEEFLTAGGTILGCGTCLRSRNFDAPEVCIFSSMKDLYALIRKNKIVLTF